MGVRDVACRYFEYVDSHDAEGLSKLFAEDGWLRPPPPVREQLQGPERIRRFYSELFTTGAPDLRIDPEYELIVDGSVCVARFSSWTHGRQNRHVIDIFRVNDRDELVEMTAYSRQAVEQEGEG